MGEAMAEIMSTVAKERPNIFQKLQTMQATPLEAGFRGCIEAGFPTTMRAG
jgi:hypothetical protein